MDVECEALEPFDDDTGADGHRLAVLRDGRPELAVDEHEPLGIERLPDHASEADELARDFDRAYELGAWRIP